MTPVARRGLVAGLVVVLAAAGAEPAAGPAADAPRPRPAAAAGGPGGGAATRAATSGTHAVATRQAALSAWPACRRPGPARRRVTARHLPAGWSRTPRRLTTALDPAECLAVASFAVPARPPERDCVPWALLRRLRPGQVVVLVLEGGASHRRASFAPRPRRFRLRPDVGAAGAGWAAMFREQGRVFYVGVWSGARLGPSLRRDVERVLDGLTIDSAG